MLDREPWQQRAKRYWVQRYLGGKWYTEHKAETFDAAKRYFDTHRVEGQRWEIVEVFHTADFRVIGVS